MEVEVPTNRLFRFRSQQTCRKQVVAWKGEFRFGTSHCWCRNIPGTLPVSACFSWLPGRATCTNRKLHPLAYKTILIILVRLSVATKMVSTTGSNSLSEMPSTASGSVPTLELGNHSNGGTDILAVQENHNREHNSTIHLQPKREGYLSWDDYFLSVAILSSKRSKDPTSASGACIVDQKNRIVGTLVVTLWRNHSCH